PQPEAPTGSLDLEADANGAWRVVLMYQRAIAQFDRKTEQLRLWAPPQNDSSHEPQQFMLEPQESRVDDKVWINDASTDAIFRLGIPPVGSRPSAMGGLAGSRTTQRLRHDGRFQEQSLFSRLRSSGHRPHRRDNRKSHPLLRLRRL